MLRAPFPDLEVEVEDVIAEDDRVVTRLTNRSTFEGAFMGESPNGNTFDAEAIEIVRFEGGKIAEMWFQLDALGMMDQLGLGPEPEEEPT